LYFLIVDTIYYWNHRIIHRVSFLKQNLHTTHHDAFHLIPCDIFYADIKETIWYTFLLAFIPLLFIKINIVEYIIINIVVFYHSLYIHSEIKEKFPLPLFINSNFHKYHHQIGRGNYSLLFPIWDKYMATIIKSSKIKKRQKRNKKHTK
jgi:sterol desaturase/sphingolipid hydroxylase (fatty acid hydroxylase superfamily)